MSPFAPALLVLVALTVSATMGSAVNEPPVLDDGTVFVPTEAEPNPYLAYPLSDPAFSCGTSVAMLEGVALAPGDLTCRYDGLPSPATAPTATPTSTPFLSGAQKRPEPNSRLIFRDATT